jgi:N-acetylmuramoyl-L-alanine amidase
MKRLKILIDPGHGGNQPGAVYTMNGVLYRESDLAYQFARSLRNQLILHGHTADYTRDETHGKPIPLRVAKSFLTRYDACVSLHLNAGGGTGWEIWYRDQDDLRLAQSIASAIRRSAPLQPLRERGLKPESMWQKGKRMGILSMRCPVVLIELAFIDNPHDLSLILQREVRIAYAKAITEGIEAFSATV